MDREVRGSETSLDKTISPRCEISLKEDNNKMTLLKIMLFVTNAKLQAITPL